MILFLARESLAWLPSPTPADACDYVSRLRAARSLQRHARVVSRDSLHAFLFERGFYPTLGEVSAALAVADPSIEPGDVMQLLATLVEKVEECSVVAEAYIDSARSVVPIVWRTLADDTASDAVAAAWVMTRCAVDGLLFTVPGVAGQCEVTATIEETDPACAALTLPFKMSRALPTCCNWVGLVGRLDLMWIWRACIVSSDSVLLLDYLDVSAPAKVEISIGKEFFGSAIGKGVVQSQSLADKLVRRVADIRMDRNLDKGHGLRTSKHGSSPLRMRGTWKAWRYDLDDEFHLHVWIADTGRRVELANVVNHNEFDITY